MRMLRVLCCAACLPLLAACDRIDLKHYRQLEAGQDMAKVTDILGKPDNCKQLLGTQTCSWVSGKRSIKVVFAGESVVFYSAEGLQ